MVWSVFWNTLSIAYCILRRGCGILGLCWSDQVQVQLFSGFWRTWTERWGCIFVVLCLIGVRYLSKTQKRLKLETEEKLSKVSFLYNTLWEQKKKEKCRTLSLSSPRCSRVACFEQKTGFERLSITATQPYSNCRYISFWLFCGFIFCRALLISKLKLNILNSVINLIDVELRHIKVIYSCLWNTLTNSLLRYCLKILKI